MKTDRTFISVAGAGLLGLLLGVGRLLAGSRNPPAMLYILLAAGLALCLGFGLLYGKKPAPETLEITDRFKTAVVLAAIVTMGGALLKLALDGADLLSLCTMALMVLSGLGMILGLKETDSQLPHILASVPIFASGLYLLLVYRSHAAAGPDSDLYAFEVLTVVALTAALYSIASMRFMDRSRSLFVTTSVLAAIMLTVCTVISTLLGSGFIFSMADLLLCAGPALYCGAWFLNPPLKYVVPEEDEEEEDAENEEVSEVIVPESDEE